MTKPVVNVLMATFNGDLYLDEQLRSIHDQAEVRINLIVSDDNSDDATVEILRRWKANWTRGEFIILSGPSSGYAENFRSLLQRCDLAADYIAFADQDDIWDADKLITAIQFLRRLPRECPGLYCSRTRLVDESGYDVGYSPEFQRPASFRNAIVQSIGGGNTMVLNRIAAQLAIESARRSSFVSHDWWCYIIVSAANGRILYDPKPRIGYRQHASNVIGRNTGWSARFRRMRRLFAGQLRDWNDQHLAALDLCSDLLCAEAKEVLVEFRGLRSENMPQRVLAFLRSGVYRQSKVGTLMLLMSVVAKKV